jgi:hypothetical protein
MLTNNTLCSSATQQPFNAMIIDAQIAWVKQKYPSHCDAWCLGYAQFHETRQKAKPQNPFPRGTEDYDQWATGIFDAFMGYLTDDVVFGGETVWAPI